MDINWPALLDEVQNIRSALEEWGITYEILFCLGVSALALFLISLREIVIWYLRISQLHNQMVKMSQQLNKIQSSVDQVQAQTEKAPNAAPIFQEATQEDKQESIEEETETTTLKKVSSQYRTH